MIESIHRVNGHAEDLPPQRIQTPDVAKQKFINAVEAMPTNGVINGQASITDFASEFPGRLFAFPASDVGNNQGFIANFTPEFLGWFAPAKQRLLQFRRRELECSITKPAKSWEIWLLVLTSKNILVGHWLRLWYIAHEIMVRRAINAQLIIVAVSNVLTAHDAVSEFEGLRVNRDMDIPSDLTADVTLPVKSIHNG